MKSTHLVLMYLLLSILGSFMQGCRKSNTTKSNANALSLCNSGSVTLATETVVTGGCIITGDLTILNKGKLNVDLTGANPQTFVIRGNILLNGNAFLWVHAAPGSTGSQFIVSSSYKGQRTITTKDSSRVQLENIGFSAQENNLSSAGSFDVNYNAFDHSTLYVNKAWLDTKLSWILCNLHNNSSLIGYNPNEVPTETYLQDSARIALHGSDTKVGLWLNLESLTGTLNLPADQGQAFSWKIGRGIGGLNAQWSLEIDTAQVGIGAQIYPSTKMTINGSGLPVTGELKVALMFSGSTDTIKNLTVGLQSTSIANGPGGWVKLNNVNLGPIAWQVYALANENLYIKKSIVNEIGIAGPSRVVVDSSLLQLAVLGAVGVGGSTMTINNTDVWNQSINAANSSSITLNNCNITGSAFSTTDALSHISVNGGCFFENPPGCTQADMVDITTGQPHCNPFISPGFPQNLTPSRVSFNGVNNNCSVRH